jgi:hypothetical protein
MKNKKRRRLTQKRVHRRSDTRSSRIHTSIASKGRISISRFFCGTAPPNQELTLLRHEMDIRMQRVRSNSGGQAMMLKWLVRRAARPTRQQAQKCAILLSGHTQMRRHSNHLVVALSLLGKLGHVHILLTAIFTHLFGFPRSICSRGRALCSVPGH